MEYENVQLRTEREGGRREVASEIVEAEEESAGEALPCRRRAAERGQRREARVLYKCAGGFMIREATKTRAEARALENWAAELAARRREMEEANSLLAR